MILTSFFDNPLDIFPDLPDIVRPWQDLDDSEEDGFGGLLIKWNTQVKLLGL